MNRSYQDLRSNDLFSASLCTLYKFSVLFRSFVFVAECFWRFFWSFQQGNHEEQRSDTSMQQQLTPEVELSIATDLLATTATFEQAPP